MKLVSTVVTSLALLGSAPALAESSVISANGSRANVSGPAQNFTGAVIVEPLYPHKESLRSTGGHVTFAPGARSAWHTHPAGQILIVTDGVGGCRNWAGRSGRSSRATSFGARRVSSIGTVPLPLLQCVTSPSQAWSMARMSSGWSTSRMSSTTRNKLARWRSKLRGPLWAIRSRR